MAQLLEAATCREDRSLGTEVDHVLDIFRPCFNALAAPRASAYRRAPARIGRAAFQPSGGTRGSGGTGQSTRRPQQYPPSHAARTAPAQATRRRNAARARSPWAGARGRPRRGGGIALVCSRLRVAPAAPAHEPGPDRKPRWRKWPTDQAAAPVEACARDGFAGTSGRALVTLPT